MTLIAIIGEFDTTLLNIVNEFADKIQKIVLVFDDTMANAKNIAKYQKALEHYKKKHNLKFIVDQAKVIDEDNTTKLDLVLTLAKENQPAMIDISNALGSTAAYLGAKISQCNFSLVAFNPYDNECNIITKEGFSNYPMQKPLALVDYIESYGYKIIQKAPTPRDKEAIFHLYKHFGDFQRARKSLLLNKMIAINTFPNIISSLRLLEIIDHQGNLIDKYYLQGGIFEDYIYHIVKDLGFDDILIGAEVRFVGNIQQKTLINNEFDILAFKNNRLYLFELKFTNSFNINEMLYKYMALKEHLKNDSKGVIITLDPKLSPNATAVDIDERLQNQAELFDIHIIRNKFKEIDIKQALLRVIYPQGHIPATTTKTPSKNFQYIYFLGGNDLEMVEIRKILSVQKAPFIDKQLAWGAKMSDYKDEIAKLTPTEVPIFVELEQDMQLDIVHEIIDHHGLYSHKPSSIEQIAKKFEIKLDRFQTLVAINDKSYIQGLKKFGASKQEIEIIRQLDKLAQGVTQEDEVLADEALKGTKMVNKIPVIFSKTNRFSAIADKVEFKDYVIYSAESLCIFTTKTKRIMKLLKTHIEQNLAYYGGTEQMFFCLKPQVLQSEALVHLANEAATRLGQKDPKKK